MFSFLTGECAYQMVGTAGEPRWLLILSSLVKRRQPCSTAVA